jgi:hypothetical protein
MSLHQLGGDPLDRIDGRASAKSRDLSGVRLDPIGKTVAIPSRLDDRAGALQVRYGCCQRRGHHAEAFGDGSAPCHLLDGRDETLAKVFGERCCHDRWPRLVRQPKA